MSDEIPRLCRQHRVMAGSKPYLSVDGERCDYGPHEEPPVDMTRLD